MKILENYSTKLVELRLYEKSHHDVFEGYEMIKSELSDLELALKEVVKKKGDMENDKVKAIKVERYKKFYDWAKFLKNSTEEERMALADELGIKTEIIKEKFDKLVDEEKISIKTKQASFTEELLSTAVMIKPLI
jgi:hypothetical protein